VRIAPDDVLERRQGLHALALLHQRGRFMKRARQTGHLPRIRQIAPDLAPGAAARIAEAGELAALLLGERALRPHRRVLELEVKAKR